MLQTAKKSSQGRSAGLPVLREPTLYTATFTFAKGEYDDEFHTLDQAIAEVARAIPGYLGEEAWENPRSGLISTVYYWDTLESLQQLIRHPKHIEAKERRAKWIKGYHIVVAQVVRSYGDGGIAHPLATATQTTRQDGVSAP